MARPKLAIPSVEKTISIPSDVITRIDLHLYSVIDGKVPHGAYSRLVTQLLRNFIQNLPPEDPQALKL